MKLFLISDTERINAELRKRLGTEILKLGGRIAYISSSPQMWPLIWYQATVRNYKSINHSISVDYFDLSSKFSDKDLRKLLQYKIIHLSGGNTFEFLAQVRERGMKEILDICIRENKLIVGTSAGAILLTPSIHTASLGIGDENDAELMDLTSLGYVNFEFYPHYYPTPEIDTALHQRAIDSGIPLYATTDSQGLFIDNATIQVYGDVKIFRP